MDASRSDVLVFFGATGDLAYKKIFPSLNEILHAAFDEAAMYRIDHYLGKNQVHNMLFFRFTSRNPGIKPDSRVETFAALKCESSALRQDVPHEHGCGQSSEDVDEQSLIRPYLTRGLNAGLVLAPVENGFDGLTDPRNCPGVPGVGGIMLAVVAEKAQACK